MLVHGEGDRFGEPFELTDPQRAFLDALYAYDRATGRRTVRRCLLGRAKGWGKTELLAAIGLQELCGPLAPKAPNIPIAAASFEQADLLFGTARVMATEGPLRGDLECFDTEILRTDGPGRMYRVAAAAGTNDGSRPTCFIADELHEWTGAKERVFLVIANSIAKRRDGLVLAISTAGKDLDSLLGRQYLHGREVASGRTRDPGLLFDWAESSARLDATAGPDVRRQMIMQANEHAERFGLLDEYERRFHEIPLYEWLRYFANQWTEGEDGWLPVGAFEDCRAAGTQLEAELPTVAMVDSAIRHDSVAVVAVQRRPRDGRIAAEAWTLRGNDLDLYDAEETERHLRQLAGRVDLAEVRFDPAYFLRSAQVLADEGLPMVEMPQSPQRMVPACGLAYQSIVGAELVHDFDAEATKQIEAGVPRAAGEGWRLSKGKSAGKIDTAVALAGAIDGLVAWEGRVSTVPEVW